MTHFLKKLTTMLTVALSAFSLKAQYAYFGDESINQKWFQIEGEHYSVIYPEGFDALAGRYLYLFESSRQESLKTLEIESKDLSIILHPYSLSGQSQISWAPKRIDITTTPNNNEFAVNWDVSQAVMQNRLNGVMTYFTTGSYVPFKILAGEQSVALGIGFHPSGGSYKGDAMLLLSDWFEGGPTNRSKIAMYYRSAFLEGDIRTPDRWRYGSYYRYTPESNYRNFFVNGMFRRYSGNLNYMGDITAHVTSHWWNLFSRWNVAYQRYIGKTQRKTWRQYLVPQLTALWSEDEKNRGEFTVTENLLPRSDKKYVEYSDFQAAEGGLFAIRRGYSYENQLVSIADGKVRYETTLPGTVSRLSQWGDKLYWSETVPDIRWSAREFSIIRSYDIKNGSTKDITTRSRLFQPKAIDGNRIAAVEYLEDGHSAIVIIDTEGNTLFKYELPANMELKEAAAIGNEIFFVAVTLDGCGLYSINDSNPVINTIVAPQSQFIEQLTTNGSELLFVSDYDDIQNIYSYSPQTATIERLTNSRFGADSPLVVDGKLVYGDYDRFGFHPVSAPLESLEREKVDFSERQVHIVEELFDQSAAPLDTVPTRVTPALTRTQVPKALFSEDIPAFEAKPYRKWASLPRLHSWAPFYASVDRITDMSYDRYYQLVAPGVSLLFQNTLGTLTAELGYSAHPENYFFEKWTDNKEWQINRWFHSAHMNINYSGLYPVFEVSVDFNDRYRTKTMVSSDYYGNPVLEVEEMQSPLISGYVKTYVPLNLSKGGWKRGLVPYAQFELSNDYYAFEGISEVYNLQHSAKAGVRYYSVTETPQSRLFPRLGYGVDTYFRLGNGIGDRYGKLLNLYAYGYLPGFTAEQGLKLTARVQKCLDYQANLFLWDNGKAPRGYKNINFGNYAKATVDYAIPINLGDVYIGFLYYLKRLQLVPFVDVAYNNTPGVPLLKDSKFYQKQFLYSYGADVLMNAHLFRIASELSFGLRYARTAEGQNYFGVIFSTGLKESFSTKIK